MRLRLLLLRLRVVPARERELERLRRARLPRRLRLELDLGERRVLREGGDRGYHALRALADELHVEPDLSVLVEARLEMRNTHQGRKRSLQARQQHGPREAALGDDPRQAAALLGHGGDAVRG